MTLLPRSVQISQGGLEKGSCCSNVAQCWSPCMKKLSARKIQQINIKTQKHLTTDAGSQTKDKMEKLK